MSEHDRLLFQAKLSRRRPAFRWLWNNHDLVVRSDSAWADLAVLARADGVPATRGALRQAWPMVWALWTKTAPELRVPLPEAAPTTKPPIASASERTRFFSDPDDGGFSLPDITGKKI